MKYSINTRKRIVSFLLVLVLIFSITLIDVKKAQAAAIGTVASVASVLASVIIAVESSETYQDWYDNELQPHYISMMNEVFERTGLVKIGFNENFTDTIFHTIGGDPIRNFIQYMASKNNVDPSSITDDQAKQGLYNMFNNSRVDGSNVVIADDLKQYFFYLQDAYIDQNKYYIGYSIDYSYFNNDETHLIVQEIKNHQDQYYCFYTYQDVNGSWPSMLICVPKDSDILFYLNGTYSLSNKFFTGNALDSKTYEDFIISSEKNCLVYEFTSSGGVLTERDFDPSSFSLKTLTMFKFFVDDSVKRSNNYNIYLSNSYIHYPQGYQFITYGKIDTLTFYNSKDMIYSIISG